MRMFLGKVSMKIFHLSDLHIGIKLYNRNLAEDQKYIFKQIIENTVKEQADVIIIAGDIYDKAVPSAEAVKLFDDFIRELYNASVDSHIMIISGNHDSAQRMNMFRWLLDKQRVHIAGLPPLTPDEHMEKVVLADEYGEVNFYLLPFVRPSMVRNVFGLGESESISYEETVGRLIGREDIDTGVRNVIVSHQFYLPAAKEAGDIERMDSEIKSVGNIDVVNANVLEKFDYAALGHIHKPMTVGEDRFRYCGTPLAYSVSEAGQEKGILSIDMGGKEEGIRITKIPLKPLREVRIMEGKLEDILKQPNDDYVFVSLTDTQDLDVIEFHEKLAGAFPNLLEIHRKNVRSMEFSDDVAQDIYRNPYELICEFLPDMDEEENAIISEVVDEVTRAKKE